MYGEVSTANRERAALHRALHRQRPATTRMRWTEVAASGRFVDSANRRGRHIASRSLDAAVTDAHVASGYGVSGAGAGTCKSPCNRSRLRFASSRGRRCLRATWDGCISARLCLRGCPPSRTSFRTVSGVQRLAGAATAAPLPRSDPSPRPSSDGGANHVAMARPLVRGAGYR
jgi:hypothetical protein